MIAVNIMSQFMAIKAAGNLTCKTAIISITGKYADDIEFTQSDNLVDVLHLHFEDFNTEHEDAMTCDDAVRIRDFININANRVERLIVHCGFGTSRSAAVGAAIVSASGGNIEDMLNNPRFNINKYCYSLTENACREHSGKIRIIFEE